MVQVEVEGGPMEEEQVKAQQLFGRKSKLSVEMKPEVAEHWKNHRMEMDLWCTMS